MQKNKSAIKKSINTVRSFIHRWLCADDSVCMLWQYDTVQNKYAVCSHKQFIVVTIVTHNKWLYLCNILYWTNSRTDYTQRCHQCTWSSYNQSWVNKIQKQERIWNKKLVSTDIKQIMEDTKMGGYKNTRQEHKLKIKYLEERHRLLLPYIQIII